VARGWARGAGYVCERMSETAPARVCPMPAVFVFFSNRLGCTGSLVVTLIGTAVLLLIFGVIDLD
jgi:hypothetical protein